MATSTTSNYNQTAGQLIDFALMDIGTVGPDSPTAPPALRKHGLAILNALIKSMEVEGAHRWRIVRRPLTTVAGQAAYVLADDIQDVDQPGRYTMAGQTAGTQVVAMSLDEYMVIGDRTLQANPTRYVIEKRLDATGLQQITLTFWPTPQASGDTFEYLGVTRGLDLTDTSQTLDVPQQWLLALRYGLDANLARAYGNDVKTMMYYDNLYAAERARALADDEERGGSTFVPFYNYAAYMYLGGNR